MICFLFQTTAAHAGLSAGEAPEGLLHPKESQRLERLTVLKRRRDWLMGRWTAKHLVQQHLRDTTAADYRLDEILILADADGAPYAALRGYSGESDDAPLHRLDLSLSISHSGDRAFCALTDDTGATIGADIEMIEPREPGLPEQFFTSAEITLIADAAPALYDTAVTAVWSAKEAVLKALRTGLRSDTRWLTCLPSQITGLPATWTPYNVDLDHRLAAQVALSEGKHAGQVGEAHWCVVLDAYIAAYAVATPLMTSTLLLPA